MRRWKFYLMLVVVVLQTLNGILATQPVFRTLLTVSAVALAFGCGAWAQTLQLPSWFGDAFRPRGTSTVGETHAAETTQ